MLHCERSQMSVGHQIAGRISRPQNLLETWPMFVTRLNDADARLLQPAFYSLSCFSQRKRAAMQAHIGADADECT